MTPRSVPGGATSLAGLFDQAADTYDRDRRGLIPCFDEMYGAALSAFDRPGRPPRTILDLGAGTGLFSALVKARFRDAEIVITDISNGMLRKARQRFAGQSNISFDILDLRAAPINGRYDAVISALAIHHLGDDDKAALMSRIAGALRPGGIFVNVDQFRADDPEEDQRLHAEWQADVLASGQDRVALDDALVRMRLDRNARLADQKAWLADAGMTAIECLFQRYFFAVLAARKPA